MLKPSNYSIWAIRMQIILEANGLWEMIEPLEITQADNKKDKIAIAFLYQALPKEQLLQITKHKIAKAIWEALKTRHIREERVQQARLQTLKSDFEMLQMKEDEKIDTFTEKLTTLVNKVASLGHTIEDQTLVRKLLNVVPDRYLQIVASIEQYSDLSKITMKEAIRRLKTYEERIKYKKGKQVDNQEKMMFTRHESKGKYFRGHGRGKHIFSQGKSQEKFKEERKDGESSYRNFNRKNFKKSSYDTIKLQCYQCKKIWHVAPNYPQRTKANKQSNLVEEYLEPTLLMEILEDSDEGNQVKKLKNKSTKDQAFDTFKEYKKTIENELRTTLKMLRTNHGREFTSNEFTQYCKENGIARQLTAPYSPQQNGVVERRNRIIMSTTRCMMKETNMRQNFWAEAVRHAIYILNSVPIKVLEDIPPYEAIKQKKPNLEKLRVFGCIAYAKVPSQRLTKLDDRSSRMVYLGIKQGLKAYRLFDPTTQKICVSRDVKFKENETWDWKEHISVHINDESEWTDFKIENLEVTSEHHDQGTQPSGENNDFPNNDNDGYTSPTIDSPSHSQTPRTPLTSSSQVNSQITPNISTQSIYQSDSGSTSTTNSHSHFDHTPLRGFRTLNDLYKNTKELLLAKDEPKNYKEASSNQKWIKEMKVELDSINMNNTCELTTLPKGHKAHWFKMEVFTPVARMETIRLLLAIAANNKQEVHHLDVKFAFLHRVLKEEVYVTQPKGFMKREDNGKVYRLIKALYGLRQAPHAWNINLDNTLKSLDFKKCALEHATYTKTSRDSTLLIGVYVDDLIITGTPKKEIDKFKAQMEEKFKMSNLGLLAYYLGIIVIQTGGDISIKPPPYANKILKEAGMIDRNETLIPMDPGTRLTKLIEETMVNSIEYQILMGCFRYLLHTRPDLSYYVRLLSRFMQEPKEQHIKAIILLSKLTHSKEEKVTIMVDNKSAIALMKSPVFHGRSKNIDTKYHFIKECVEREDIQVESVLGRMSSNDSMSLPASIPPLTSPSTSAPVLCQMLIYIQMKVQQELPSQATSSWSGSKTITPMQEEDDIIKKCIEVLPAWTGSIFS
uniref:Ribonuclease H-like domain, reverse transcriptase, RNA-dependent DNA polymerase n=1 Tax=Tanacetum cinerariifolium TaxID=118510 RepID=A0A699GPJ2_TANCI|nr:ribonuclease H-like domain, reverse transcriptase, RNA-dependent DNA polymerase [Tanacetum cinerariifolium]